MDPLTLALLAGGASLVGGLPDIIPSKHEREQKKELKDLQRRQELGLLGLTEREQQQIANQYGVAQQQAQAYQDAQMARYGAQSAQPGMAALGMVAAGEQAQRLGQQSAQNIAQLDLARQAEESQYIKDLQAAQAEYKKARAEALVKPLVEGATAGISAGIQQEAFNKLIGAGISPTETVQPIARTTDPRMEIARLELVNDSPYGMTEDMFTTWWSGIDDKQKNYYGRIK